MRRQLEAAAQQPQGVVDPSRWESLVRQAETAREQFVDWVSGACLLVYRADAEAAGLLDERFFLYTEDVDLCASVRARGRDVLFVADVEILHLRGRSGRSAPHSSKSSSGR